MAFKKEVFQTLPWGPVLGCLGAVALSLGVAGGLWFGQWQAQAEVERVNDELAAQKMLRPYVENVQKRQVSIQAQLATSKVYAKPTSVTQMLGVLKIMAADAGIPNITFVPDAVSVVGRDDIRLVGQGAGTTEGLRRFTLALSDQPWVTKLEYAKAFSSDEAHAFDLAIRATYVKPTHREGVSK